MALTLVAQPSEISWSRHPLRFVASSDAVGSVRIRQELRLVADDSLIAKTANLPLDADDAVSYDWSKIITDQVSGEVPQLVKLGYTHTKSSLPYYVRFVEVVDGVDGATLDSSDRWAIFGSNEFFLDKYYYLAIDTGKDYLFMSAKPDERELLTDQENVLTVLFNAAIANPVLNITLHYTSGDPEVVNTNITAAAKGEMRTFDLSFREWDFAAVDAERDITLIEVKITGAAGGTITYKVKDQSYKWRKDFIFANYFGGFDVLATTGANVESDEQKGEIYLVTDTTGTKRSRSRQEPRVDKFVQNSGFIPKAESRAYRHMREVNRVWQVLKEQQLAMITLDLGTTEILADGANLNSFSISYTFGDGRQDFDTINAIKFINEGGDLSLPIDMTDVTGLVAALAGKVPITTPTALTDGASVAIDCASSDNKLFTLSSSNTTCTLALANLADGHTCQIQVVPQSTATFTYTFTHTGLTCLVADAGSGVWTVDATSAKIYRVFATRIGSNVLISFDSRAY